MVGRLFARESFALYRTTTPSECNADRVMSRKRGVSCIKLKVKMD